VHLFGIFIFAQRVKAIANVPSRRSLSTTITHTRGNSQVLIVKLERLLVLPSHLAAKAKVVVDGHGSLGPCLLHSSRYAEHLGLYALCTR
jgi:hypothetical protein